MLDVIKNRRSVREFSTKEIKREDLVELCEAGFMAPSARNQASRAFIIIEDKAVIANLVNISPGARVLTTCNKVIAVICPKFNSLPTKSMALEDLGAATQNILLEATSKKIGSCWIGIAPDYERMTKVAKVLGLEEDSFVFSLIALGYPLAGDKAFYQKDKIDQNLISFR